MANDSQTRAKLEEFIRKADEADRQAARSADALVRVQWQNIARSYRNLAQPVIDGRH